MGAGEEARSPDESRGMIREESREGSALLGRMKAKAIFSQHDISITVTISRAFVAPCSLFFSDISGATLRPTRCYACYFRSPLNTLPAS